MSIKHQIPSLAEILEKFPIGTSYLPAHITVNNTLPKTIKSTKFKFSEKYVLEDIPAESNSSPVVFHIDYGYAKILKLPPSFNTPSERIPSMWQLKITEDNLDLVNKFRDYRDYRILIMSDTKKYPYITENGSGNDESQNRTTISNKQFETICLLLGISIDENKSDTIKIDNSNDLPVKWMMQVDKENFQLAQKWRESIATENMESMRVGHTLLSKHHMDLSYFHTNPLSLMKRHDVYKDYEEIAFEQFKNAFFSNESKSVNNNAVTLPDKWVIPIHNRNLLSINAYRNTKNLEAISADSIYYTFMNSRGYGINDNAGLPPIITDSLFNRFLVSQGIITKQSISAQKIIAAGEYGIINRHFEYPLTPEEAFQGESLSLKSKRNSIQVKLIPVKQRRII